MRRFVWCRIRCGSKTARNGGTFRCSAHDPILRRECVAAKRRATHLQDSTTIGLLVPVKRSTRPPAASSGAVSAKLR